MFRENVLGTRLSCTFVLHAECSASLVLAVHNSPFTGNRNGRNYCRARARRIDDHLTLKLAQALAHAPDPDS